VVCFSALEANYFDFLQRCGDRNLEYTTEISNINIYELDVEKKIVEVLEM
jgi:hypothetical protein